MAENETDRLRRVISDHAKTVKDHNEKLGRNMTYDQAHKQSLERFEKIRREQGK